MANSPAAEESSKHPRQSFWQSRAELLWLGVAVFLLHFLVTGGHLLSPDEELLYRMSESLAFRGTTEVVPLEADIATGELPPGFPAGRTFATQPGDEPGEFHAQYLPLQPLLAVPIVWAGKALEGIFAEPFASAIPPGMTVNYLKPLGAPAFQQALFRRGLVAMLFNPLVAALSAIALARLATLLTGLRRAGLGAAALWALATMAWPHSRTFFTEPLAGLFALLAIDQMLRWFLKPQSEGMRHAVWMGVFLALGNWTRVDSPLFTAGFVGVMAVLAVWRFLREESFGRVDRRLPFLDVLVAGGIAFGAWLLLQGFNSLRYGGVDLTSGYGDQAEAVKFTTPLLVGLHGLLFSPGKGLLWFSPGIVLGIWGWFRVPKGLKWLPTAVLLGYVPFFLAMAMWQNWDGGWCWGPRHIVQIQLPIMLGAAFLFTGPPSQWRRLAVLVVLIAGAGVQLYGSSQSPLDYYHEYFRTFDDLEYHRVNLTPMQQQAISREYTLRVVRPDGSAGQAVSPTRFPAPMIDSIYLPQHTQWSTYAQMWRFGYCDWYFLNAIRGVEEPDRWSETP